MMNIILAGGSGFIGKNLAKRLVEEGHGVWVLSRNPDARKLVRGVIGIRWDASTAEGWGNFVEEADAIVNLTGENLASGLWTKARKNRLLTSRVNSGRAIVDAIRKASHRPSVVIQSSGIHYYGDAGNQILHEDAPAGKDFKAQLCVQWEDSSKPVEELGVRRAVIRTSIVLEKDSFILKMFMLPFRLLFGGRLGSGKQWVPWIHRDDYIGAMLHILKHESAEGPFNMSSPLVLQNIDFEKTIGRVLKRPYWFPTPAFLLRFALGEISGLVLEGQRVSADKLLNNGYVFKYSTLESALSAILHSPGE